jgi:hypothetical protein
MPTPFNSQKVLTAKSLTRPDQRTACWCSGVYVEKCALMRGASTTPQLETTLNSVIEVEWQLQTVW